MEDFKCKDCGHEEFEVINIQTKIEKEAKMGQIIMTMIGLVLGIIGIIIIISNAIKLNDLNYSGYGNDIISTIDRHFENLILCEKYKSKISLGIGLAFIGFIVTLFFAIWYNMDAAYKVTNEPRRMCKNCGRKHKIKKPEKKIRNNIYTVRIIGRYIFYKIRPCGKGKDKFRNTGYAILRRRKRKE